MTASVSLSIGLTEPIGDWRTLVNSVRSWLNRSEEDLSDTQVTEFIALAEAKFNRVLRVSAMEEVSTALLNDGNNDLPSNFLSMRGFYIGREALDAMTPTDMVATYGDCVGIPTAYTILDANPRKVRLAPQPGVDTRVTLIYYSKIEGVSENNPDNWLLNDHPDIYLWGTLLCAEAYIADDERVAGWENALDKAISQLIISDNQDKFGASPLVPRGQRMARGAVV